MTKILLFCSVGFSTSLLMSKMKEEAKRRNYPCEIEAYSVSDVAKKIQDADIVLLGPQIRFEYQGLKKAYPDKLIECIDMRMYGTMDGAAVMEHVIETLNHEKGTL